MRKSDVNYELLNAADHPDENGNGDGGAAPAKRGGEAAPAKGKLEQWRLIRYLKKIDVFCALQ